MVESREVFLQTVFVRWVERYGEGHEDDAYDLEKRKEYRDVDGTGVPVCRHYIFIKFMNFEQIKRIFLLLVSH